MNVVKTIGYLLLFLLAGAPPVMASHIAGGEMYYTYNGPGSKAGTNNYTITLRLFRECNPAPVNGQTVAPLPANVIIAVFDIANSQLVNSFAVDSSQFQVISLHTISSCIINPPQVCYQVASYSVSTDLPVIAGGYIASFQTCCRAATIVNVVQSQIPGTPYSGEGATYTVTIPGTDILGTSSVNSSPQFGLTDTVLVCQNRKFTLNFSAIDPDKDSLSYFFCSAFNRGNAVDASNIIPSSPSTFSPYYNPVSYTTGFSGTAPLGSGASMNPSTGIISGVAPAAGSYVISVCVNEWRGGVVINVDRKDFILKVTTCDFPDATLPTSQFNCDSLSVSFSNLTNSSTINNYFWSFGVPGSVSDTSVMARPTFQYAHTGLYTITLIVNKGQECTDTAQMQVGVYPGFHPGFTAVYGCVGLPVQFKDTTTAQYGSVDSWRWNFGDPSNLGDTSLLRNPSYQYPDTGAYIVNLYVQSSKGCSATVTDSISLFTKPPLKVTGDTIMCYLDTLQLGARGFGTFTWTPDYNISNINIDSPLVHPQNPTTYYVTLTFAPGCTNTDSVYINVLHAVSLSVSNDTVVCAGDSTQLRAVSDGITYLWTPATFLNDSASASPVAHPLYTIQYRVTAAVGSCISASGEVTVNVAPYPTLAVSADTSICYGDSALLRVTGGDAVRFIWSPFNSLNDDNTPSVYADPLSSTRYIVAGYGNGLCPKPVYDTITLTIVPPVIVKATDDTAIVVGQPLQLQASGAVFYQWTPPTGLNNPTIFNPIAILSDSITYIVKVSTAEGCSGFDTVHVAVFKTKPDIFVPSAFTPNNDSHNDLFRTYPVGIADFEYFRVYNRWGQEVFGSSDPEQGWNGRFNGRNADAGAYVWMVKGVDYLGNTISKKGTVVLIR